MDSLAANLPLAAQILVQTAKDNGGYDNVSVILAKRASRSQREPQAGYRARLGSLLFRAEALMAKLVLSAGGAVVHQCFVDGERLTVGREAHNQIVIDDPAVSREHAAIVAVGNDHVLEDLQARTGRSGQRDELRAPDPAAQRRDRVRRVPLRYLEPEGRRPNRPRAHDADPGARAGRGPAGQRGVEQGSRSRRTSTSRRRARPALAFSAGRIKWLQGPHGGEAKTLDRVIATFGTAGEAVAVVTRRPHGFYVTHVEGEKSPACERGVDRDASRGIS